MSRKKTAVAAPPKGAVNAGVLDADAVARTILRPSVGAALATKAYSHVIRADLEIPALINALSEQCGKASGGDLTRAEELLTVQAHTLDAIFNRLAIRAADNIGHYPEAVERYLKLALRAQSQSRATIETLATIKNPPVVIARQANIAHGPQQVNNDCGARTLAGAHARELQNEQSKLLEQTHGQRVDTGATGGAIGRDSKMASVGARPPAHGQRQVKPA